MNPTERYSFDRRTQEILENLTIPFAIYQYIDKRVVTIALSKGFCDQFGFKRLEDAYHAMDNDMYRATHPDDKTRVADAAYRFAAFGAPYDIVYRTRTLKDPDYIILHAYGEVIHPEPGARLCLTWYANEGHYSPEQGTYGSVLNQTLNRVLTEESQHRGVYYDYMTGLPNMAYFFELAEAGCKRMGEQGVDSAILFFDLTGLKHFNRWHGFAEGNHLIRAVAAILAKHFSSENCARFAQDHFAAFAPERGLQEILDAVMEECAAVNDGKTLPLRVGIYPNRIEAVEIDTACDRARLAANVRKNRKGSYYSYFDMEMLAEEKNRQEIIDNLDRAMAEGWIQVYLQPIIRAVNEKVCDVEALARWIDPKKGVLSPASFIPALEDAGLIYKLDLYMVDRVVEVIRRQMADGFSVIPHSVNLSRSDFDACDIVEEIRRRVDDAGVSRDRITIEITESVIGSDFEFMKEQVERFRKLGFPVWMDDFGSGYSSLDVLQSIKFDLIKFDMSFMRKLDEGENGKIILTELMRMATALGVDTVCEGVETEAQVRFLQDIGCSKLQGFYFCKPVPFEKILESTVHGFRFGYENPDEAAYFEAIGRVNLYDLDVLANREDGALQNAFNTLPMGIMEISGNRAKYVRSNQAYREFVRHFFNFDIASDVIDFGSSPFGEGSMFLKAVKQCCDNGNRAFFDERMPDGTVVHQFIRRIDVNPVNGNTAVAIAVLSISEPSEGATYADIARALAADYYNIYVVDLDTEQFLEYTAVAGGEDIAVERRGENFFEAARRDTMTRIYEEDREPFLASFSKEKVIQALDAQGVYTATYRLIDTGTPMYASLKLTRMQSHGNHIIMGVSIIESLLRQKEEDERLHQQNIVFGRIAALSGKMFALYTVDPVTGLYSEFNVTSGYGDLGFDKKGENFFIKGRSDGEQMVCHEDLDYFKDNFTKENILRDVREKGLYQIRYRLVINGEPKPILLKAAMVEESDGEKLIVGVNIENP